MTEIKNRVFLSDADASIARLLSGLNFETFQKQQEYLKNLKVNQESEHIVTGILDLMDRVAGIYEETTGKSLTNRFDAIEEFANVLLLLEDATAMDYTLPEFFLHACGNCVPSDDIFGYAHIRFGSIMCTIAISYGIFVPVGPVYVLNTKDESKKMEKPTLERLSRKTFNYLLKDAKSLTLEEMEAAELCAGGTFDDLR